MSSRVVPRKSISRYLFRPSNKTAVIHRAVLGVWSLMLATKSLADCTLEQYAELPVVMDGRRAVGSPP